MPGATVDATVMVAVDEPEPGAAMDVGLKVIVTPDGAPDAERATAELKPPEIAVVMFEDPPAPALTPPSPAIAWPAPPAVPVRPGPAMER